MFEQIQFSRISQGIIEQIREAILNESLKPGDRLPSEAELARRFGVSKASLREAYRALEALGLLEIRQGISGGAFVRKVDIQTARDSLFNYIFFQNPSIVDFTQLRSILEPQISEIAAQKISDSQLARIEDNLLQTKDNLNSGTYIYKLDITFHREIASITQNPLIVFLIDILKDSLFNIKKLLQPDLKFAEIVYSAHCKIFEALRDRDPDKAREEMRQHIIEVDNGLRALVKAKEHLIFDARQKQLRFPKE
jgi:GntR family transcriptional repressor for pyruvate dehydrogenase complex